MMSRMFWYYDEVGLVFLSCIGDNGYCYYDWVVLVWLQCVLMLCEFGLGILVIVEMLVDQCDDVVVFESYLVWLEFEQERIVCQMVSVCYIIDELKGGEQIMVEYMFYVMFDGFDYMVFCDEVEQKWGCEVYDCGDFWWGCKMDVEKVEWKVGQVVLQFDWVMLVVSGVDLVVFVV